MISAQYTPETIIRRQISLTLDSDRPCVSIRLRGPVPSASLREVHQQALLGLASAQSSQLLCDLSELETFSFPDQQWFTRQWLPHTAQAGYRAVALVMPFRTVSQAAARSVTVLMEQHGVHVFVTGELARAQQWLESFGRRERRD